MLDRLCSCLSLWICSCFSPEPPPTPEPPVLPLLPFSMLNIRLLAFSYSSSRSSEQVKLQFKAVKIDADCFVNTSLSFFQENTGEKKHLKDCFSPILLLRLLPASLTLSPESQLQLSLFKISFLWPLCPPSGPPPPELAPRFSSLTCLRVGHKIPKNENNGSLLLLLTIISKATNFILTVMCSLNLRSGSLVFLVLLTMTQLPDWSTLWSNPK